VTSKTRLSGIGLAETQITHVICIPQTPGALVLIIFEQHAANKPKVIDNVVRYLSNHSIL